MATRMVTAKSARSALTPENGADADVRGAFLGGDSVVLARAHRQLTKAVPGGQLAQAAEVRPRGFRVARQRRHRHQAADIGVLPQEFAQLLGWHAGFRVLPGEVDLDE